MSNSVQPHRRQPTRLHHPWDSPGKNTGVDDPEGWYREGGGRGVQDGEHMYTHSRFILMYSKINTILKKKKKKKGKKESEASQHFLSLDYVKV